MEWDTVGWPSKPQNSVQTRYLRLKRVGCGTRWWRAWQRVTSFAYDSSVDPWRCLCCEDATSSVHLLFESFPFFPPSRMQIRHRAMTGKWVAGWTGGWLGGGPGSWVFLFLDWCVGMQIRNRRRGTVYFSRDLLVSQKENKKLQWKMAATNQEMHPFFFQCFKNKKEWPYRKCPLSFFFSWHHRGGSGTVTVETNSAYKFIFFLSQKVAVKRGEIQILRRFSDGELVTLDSWKKGLRGSVWLMIDERWPKSLIQNNSFFFNIYMYIKRQQLRKIRTGSQSVKLMNYENVRRNSLQVRLDFNQSWPPWVALAGDGGFYWVLSLGFY